MQKCRLEVDRPGDPDRMVLTILEGLQFPGLFVPCQAAAKHCDLVVEIRLCDP
ncbi:hypothetical protein MPHL43072_04330 [Mycolicibacterium phlei DSM 43072]|uniref:Uncharacterized protein n=1 Tax=Mycolicibacterium phlei DSM 43239 = CCUG 21000 TaxID=1226750 RepID=A0A5N5UVE7_MYCPH|nr:hypothetical protein MPHL21000_20315 [Mycolicibacterium phlei DSM 43239 = CCUG 21000]KXW62494.1 hypothetical protein MPHL43239_19380 [Mycolicibacterium phlei DSM 43239 = CCUG 21000]KXW69884.1 hypothetical protein MPHL43072_04330 [Mycolicibacterium phlei DSM 43072]KXW70394.1 hypothetical protein MPHL43070_17235 [Mycolicibacterium phlei DSM 43070]